jgi:hypothetical protein
MWRRRITDGLGPLAAKSGKVNSKNNNKEVIRKD